MKIVFIGQKGIPARTGGVERYVESLASNLTALGQEVLVYSRKAYLPDKIKEYKGAKIITLPALRGKNFEAISHTFFACLDLLWRKVNIIHVQSVGPASLIWLIKLLKPRVPVIFTFHCQDYYHQKWGLFARLYLRFGEWIGCRLADKVITISKELTEYVGRRYGREAIYIPNGATPSEKVSVQEIRRWGLEGNDYFVYIGRLVRHKGVRYLIDAYKRLKTDKKLVIVGEGSYTDDYVRELHAAAEGDDRIIFTGNQTGRALAELYSNAYLFIQPSESEGLSIALLEAMGYKTACLASDIIANIEALGQTGFYFSNKNTDDLEAKLRIALENPEQVAAKAAEGYERIKQEFDWRDIAKKVLAVYGR
ncbi:MAG: glycosyltransferase family 4 protein [Patescibacteria group bacterium]